MRIGEQMKDADDDDDDDETDESEQELQLIGETPQALKTRDRPHAFADLEVMKEAVRANLAMPVYDVRNYYKTTGWFQATARREYFANAVLVVIAFNSIWIGYDTDYNDASTLLQAHVEFQVMEHFFCFVFSLEWFIRFMAFEWKLNCLKDAWFVFDTGLVALMITETWILNAVLLITGSNVSVGSQSSILRLLRLLRLSRLARMLRSFPELMIIVRGLMAATRPVLLTLSLLAIVLYVFSIILTQLAAGSTSGDTVFFNIPSTMYYLAVSGIFFDELTDFIVPVGQDNWSFGLVFFLFVLIGTLTVMNMLIAVLCEMVSAVAATERAERMGVLLRARLTELYHRIDTDGDGISYNEFSKLITDKDCTDILQEVGVDPLGLADFGEFLFQDPDRDEALPSARLSLQTFMDIVLQLRGNLTVTVKDVIDIRKYLSLGFGKSNKRFQKQKIDRTKAFEEWDLHAATYLPAAPRMRKLKASDQMKTFLIELQDLLKLMQMQCTDFTQLCEQNGFRRSRKSTAVINLEGQKMDAPSVVLGQKCDDSPNSSGASPPSPINKLEESFDSSRKRRRPSLTLICDDSNMETSFLDSTLGSNIAATQSNLTSTVIGFRSPVTNALTVTPLVLPGCTECIPLQLQGKPGIRQSMRQELQKLEDLGTYFGCSVGRARKELPSSLGRFRDEVQLRRPGSTSESPLFLDLRLVFNRLESLLILWKTLVKELFKCLPVKNRRRSSSASRVQSLTAFRRSVEHRPSESERPRTAPARRRVAPTQDGSRPSRNGSARPGSAQSQLHCQASRIRSSSPKTVTERMISVLHSRDVEALISELLLKLTSLSSRYH